MKLKKTLSPLFLWYLRVLAKIQLAKSRPTIIGVGGASGKTSLSEFISLILKEKFKVLETKGKNSSTGIPLSILKFKPEEYYVSIFFWPMVAFSAIKRVFFDWGKFDILVAEMGIDAPTEPNNMSYLLKIVKPKIAVLTNISFEHSVYFEKTSRTKNEIFSETAKQESMLLKSLPKDGTAIINLDDENISKIEDIKAEKITVGSKNKESQFFIEKVEIAIKSFRVVFKFEDKDYELKLKRPLPKHYANSFIFAIAVCAQFGVSINESINILEKKFSLPPGRLSIFEGKKNTTILDSSYNNATIQPILDILDLMRSISGKRRKVAIVGDMRELGRISGEYHKMVAQKLLSTADLAILIGPMMSKYAAPVLEKYDHNFYNFQTFSEAKRFINEKVKEGDLILVKGSQNTLFLERAVEMLLKNPKDKMLLCRRGRYWDKIRSQTN